MVGPPSPKNSPRMEMYREPTIDWTLQKEAFRGFCIQILLVIQTVLYSYIALQKAVVRIQFHHPQVEYNYSILFC
jgi:hypothetical protein